MLFVMFATRIFFSFSPRCAPFFYRTVNRKVFVFA